MGRIRSLKFLDQLTTPKLSEFRASWDNSALTTNENITDLIDFSHLHGE